MRSTAAEDGRAVLYYKKSCRKALLENETFVGSDFAKGISRNASTCFFPTLSFEDNFFFKAEEKSLLSCPSSSMILCVFPFACSHFFSLSSLIIHSVITFICILSFRQNSLNWGRKDCASMLSRSLSDKWNFFSTPSMKAVTILFSDGKIYSYRYPDTIAFFHNRYWLFWNYSR